MPKPQLGLGGAIVIGLASMLGAGVFVVFASAYQISLNLIFVSIALAAIVAALNSAAIYQLARQIDRPGGVYAYSRVYLNESWSFLSGFGFVFGKIASIAAIALVFQRYVFPEIPFWPAALAISLLTLVNILGINRTALVATVLSVITVGFFLMFSALGLANPVSHYDEAFSVSPENPINAVLVGAGVVFFAFAGYARVATLGDEVRNSKRDIPKAIVISLGFVMALYAVLAWVLLSGLGVKLQLTETPVAELFENLTGITWITPTVAAIASLGSMLALLAGVSRTAASMAEDSELPKIFKLRNRFNAPWVAEVLIAAGAILLTAIGEIVWVIGFSSFSVLFYYSVGHLSALNQPKAERLVPRWLNVVGLTLCAALAISFGFTTFLISAGILALAFGIRGLWLSQRPR
jgi:APA family basic amino acid/polyamine antiporter